VHWNGQTFRFLPSDSRPRVHNEERYGETLPEEMTVQDYGVTYDELEPHFDYFEKLCGISGKAGNLRGEIRQEGGNPFEGWRSDEYPNPPMEMTFSQDRFEAAARGDGPQPVPGAAANMSRAYTNPLGVQLAPCTYCGFCEKYGCGNYSKASPQTTILPVLMKKPNFTLRTYCEVLQVDKVGRREPRDGRHLRRRAGRALRAAGGDRDPLRLPAVEHAADDALGIGEIYDPRTGEGLVGKNYTYQVMSGSTSSSRRSSPTSSSARARSAWWSTTTTATTSTTRGSASSAAPISPAGPPTSGRSRAIRCPKARRNGGRSGSGGAANFLKNTSLSVHGASMAHRENYLDLDPTYRDAWGRPLMRMTYDFTENDRRLSAHITPIAEEIARGMGGREIAVSELGVPYDIKPYQTTHNTGGTIMGATPGRQRGQPLPAELGSAQPLRDGRRRLPAERRLQPHRHGRRAHLLVGAGDPEQYLREPRPAGAGMMGPAGSAGGGGGRAVLQGGRVLRGGGKERRVPRGGAALRRGGGSAGDDAWRRSSAGSTSRPWGTA
jgi:gluconate 2-dehydrogenase alpha chain